MQKQKVNPTFIVIGAILVICLAAVFIFQQATAPNQSINPHPERIPPKGASAHADKQ